MLGQVMSTLEKRKMNFIKSPLAKTIFWGALWPLSFFLITYHSMESILEAFALLGSIPSFFGCWLLGICNWQTPLFVIPSFIIISLPYVWYLVEEKEINTLYWVASIYSFCCSALGAICIYGKYA